MSGPRHPLIEVEVSAALARDLLVEQHPDLADLSLHGRVHGWDNITWRLGETLALRFPVREVSAPLVATEHRWLPQLAARVPVPVPAPVRTGRPSARYPWPWTVVPWFPGSVVAATDVTERTPWAHELAEALAALHVPAPADAPVNPYRGCSLASRADVVGPRLTDAPGIPHRAALVDAWRDGLAAPVWDRAPVWVHGDPHPGNLVSAAGRLTALLDFGDLGHGDPASDLATGWLTFDVAGREAFVGRTAQMRPWDDATWRRARAWAAGLVPVFLAHPEEYPLMARVGRHAAEQVAAS